MLNKQFEIYLYNLEQALYQKLGYGVYKYRDIEYILGEIRKLWNAQKTDTGRQAVLSKIEDPDEFIRYWKNIDECSKIIDINEFFNKDKIMKNKYTKKQIQEAINYWKNQLAKLNESSDSLNTYSVTLLRDQLCSIDITAVSEEEALEIAQNIIDEGRLDEYINKDSWESQPIEVGDIELA